MKKHRQFGSQISIISVVVWSGNELCGDRGIEPLDQWGQRDPKGDFNQLMDLVWWNSHLKDLGVDQAALAGEPDNLVYGLMIFTTFVERVKAWFKKDIASENESIHWIKNDKLPFQPASNLGTASMYPNQKKIDQR